MKKKKIKLGGVYEDKVTGFTGTCTCISEYLYNPTRRVLLEVKEGENKAITEQWLDENRLKGFN